MKSETEQKAIECRELFHKLKGELKGMGWGAKTFVFLGSGLLIALSFLKKLFGGPSVTDTLANYRERLDLVNFIVSPPPPKEEEQEEKEDDAR